MRFLKRRAALAFSLALNPCFAGDGLPGQVAAGDVIAYSNTVGQSATAYGAGVTISDDMSTIFDNGCALSRIEFEVDGNTDGNGQGPFAVDYELFEGCPDGGGAPIEGTRGRVHFPNNARYKATFSVPPNSTIAIPRTVWLALTFDREHAGWVGGAPPLVGASDDWFSYPLFGCAFSFGGYPAAPHGSMNAKLFVRPECEDVHAGYHVKAPRRGPYNPGANIRMADDVTLDGICNLVGYEVTVRGTALFDMDLRAVGPGGLPGFVIGGTSGTIQNFGNFVRTLRIDLSSPVALPQRLWVTVAADSSVGRTLISGLPARIGQSEPGYAILTGNSWHAETFPIELANGAFEVTILCDGPAELGACCDMQFPDEAGLAVCRDVSRANCPYPAVGSPLLPAWKADSTCSADPFNPPCGAFACCLADGTCQNLTESQCAPRGVSWTLGRYCGAPEVDCDPMCIMSEEPCTSAHSSPGCINPHCCEAVCDSSGQSFCCNVEWDRSCVRQAAEICGLRSPNDECFSPATGEGARLLTTTSTADADVLNATESPSDPGFCCHLDEPGRAGVGTIWYRFNATATTMRLRTCQSNAPASDSLIQVFEPLDSSTPQAACTSLRSLGCNDDANSCSSGGRNSILCLRNLTVGRTYYVILAAKNDEARGVYTLALSNGCADPVPPVCACPSGPVVWIDPPNGAVDARRPFPGTDSSALEGLQSFLVQAPLGTAHADCWQLCETSAPAAPNAVEQVTSLGDGLLRIDLQRPIPHGAATTLTMKGSPTSMGVFYSHPANITADSAASPGDLLDLIDALNGIRFLPFGNLSGDMDRSGVIAPADILEAIDLLNGAGEFAVWNGTPLPDPTPCQTSQPLSP